MVHYRSIMSPFPLLATLLAISLLSITVQSLDDKDFAQYKADFKHTLSEAPSGIRDSPRAWAAFFHHAMLALGNRLGKEARIDIQHHFELIVGTLMRDLGSACDTEELRSIVDTVWDRMLDNWRYLAGITNKIGRILQPIEREDATLLGALPGAEVATEPRLNNLYDLTYSQVHKAQAEMLSRVRKVFEAFTSVAGKAISKVDDSDNAETLFEGVQQTVILLLQLAVQIEGGLLEEFSQFSLVLHAEVNAQADRELHQASNNK